jgi:hypothetical protein
MSRGPKIAVHFARVLVSRADDGSTRALTDWAYAPQTMFPPEDVWSDLFASAQSMTGDASGLNSNADILQLLSIAHRGRRSL